MSERLKKFREIPGWPLRIGDYDRIVLNKQELKQVFWNDSHQSFARIGTDGIDLTLTNEEVHTLHQRGELTIDRLALHPQVLALRKDTKVRSASEADPEAVDYAAWKQAYCDEMLRMMAENPNVRRDDASMKENVKIIHAAIYDRTEQSKSPGGKAGKVFPMRRRPSGSQVRKWLTQYLNHDCDPLSLLDRRKLNSGNRDPRFPPEVGTIMDAVIPVTYIHRDRPSAAKVLQKVEQAIAAQNAKRAEGCLALLPTPGLRTIQREIKKLNKAQVCVGRYGYAAARKLLGAAHQGIRVIRPMERVEMDEWKISLHTLMTRSGIFEHLTEEQRAVVARDRCWVTCAIDVATRCIVALDLTARGPGAASSLRALEMIVTDKTEIGRSAGTALPWFQNGRVELLVTDNGPAFIAAPFKVAVANVASDRATAPAGFPEMRATIERFFGTCSTMLLPYLPGRAFSNTVEKGDYDSDAVAAISMDELFSILVRFVVDVYHVTPHEGLRGERPLDAWQRLTELYAVMPSPSRDERRHIFGVELERTITKEGIDFLRLPYQSEDLQNIWIASNINPVRIRIDHFDVGAISVFDGKGWISVPCLVDEVHSLTVPEWIEFLARTASMHDENAVIYHDIIRAALADIERTADRAMVRLGISSGSYSAAELDAVDSNIKLVFRLRAPRPTPEGDLLDVTDADRAGGTDDVVIDLEPAPEPSNPPKKTQKGQPSKGAKQSGGFGPSGIRKKKKL